MIPTLIIFGLLFVIVLIHEAGHLIVAKKCGVGVPVFSIGFGPRLIGFKFYHGKVAYRILNMKPSNKITWGLAETEYRLAPIPFGGFCSVQGEMKNSTITNKKDLISKPYFQKVMVAFGGVTANIITGLIAICSVTVPKFGILQGIKLAVMGTMNTIQMSFFYTYLLLTGQTEFNKWSTITTSVSQISGVQEFLIYFGLLSILMAIFNLIPFPGLDGSLPLLWGLEKICGKQLGQKIANILAFTGVAFLMLLQLLIVVYWIFTA